MPQSYDTAETTKVKSIENGNRDSNLKSNPTTMERLKSTVPARLAEKADQVLLGLSHTGQSIPMLLKQTFNKIDGNPNDVIGRISRTVLEQAQSVRQTLATKGAQLSEIADTVTTRVKNVNPFGANGEAASATTAEVASSGAKMNARKVNQKKSLTQEPKVSLNAKSTKKVSRKPAKKTTKRANRKVPKE